MYHISTIWCTFCDRSLITILFHSQATYSYILALMPLVFLLIDVSDTSFPPLLSWIFIFMGVQIVWLSYKEHIGDKLYELFMPKNVFIANKLTLGIISSHLFIYFVLFYISLSAILGFPLFQVLSSFTRWATYAPAFSIPFLN